jgi:hypothetical protein
MIARRSVWLITPTRAPSASITGRPLIVFAWRSLAASSIGASALTTIGSNAMTSATASWVGTMVDSFGMA